jgi:hypothetical protein
MGEEILVRPTTIAKLKVDGITEDSLLFYTMVKVNSTFDKLEEGIFDTPIATSPHVGHTSESALAFSQSQYERSFYYYFDQHGILILKSQSKLTFSAPETDRASSGGATTIPPCKRLSYCYFDQNGKLNFRKKPVLVSSVPKTDRANSGEATTIPHEKHEKRHKSARLNFSRAKEVVYLSSDYYIIDEDQTPTSEKGRLPAYPESAEPTLKSVEPTPACSKTARLTSQLAKPTTFATCSESARLTASTACSESAKPTSQLARPTTSAAYPESAKLASQSAKPTTPASAQVGLADS